jgi:hypothetical protein
MDASPVCGKLKPVLMQASRGFGLMRAGGAKVTATSRLSGGGKVQAH